MALDRLAPHRAARSGAARCASQLGAGERVDAVDRRRVATAPRMAIRVTAGRPARWPLRITLTIAGVLAASLIALMVRPVTHAADSPLFVAAVTASAWLGGLGCGLLATVLSSIALDAVMAPTWPSFTLTEEAIARLVVFVL